MKIEITPNELVEFVNALSERNNQCNIEKPDKNMQFTHPSGLYIYDKYKKEIDFSTKCIQDMIDKGFTIKEAETAMDMMLQQLRHSITKSVSGNTFTYHKCKMVNN